MGNTLAAACVGGGGGTLGSCRSVPCYLHPSPTHHLPQWRYRHTQQIGREGLRHSRGVPCTFLLMGVTFCYGFYLFVLEFHLFFHILDFTNSNYFVCIVNTEDTSVVSSNHLPDRWPEPSSDLTQIQVLALASSSASSLQFCSVSHTNGVNPSTQLKVASAFQSELRKRKRH